MWRGWKEIVRLNSSWRIMKKYLPNISWNSMSVNVVSLWRNVCDGWNYWCSTERMNLWKIFSIFGMCQAMIVVSLIHDAGQSLSEVWISWVVFTSTGWREVGLLNRSSTSPVTMRRSEWTYLNNYIRMYLIKMYYKNYNKSLFWAFYRIIFDDVKWSQILFYQRILSIVMGIFLRNDVVLPEV